MKERITILCATDDGYAPYCGIMLTSLFENNRDREIRVFVLVDKPLLKKHRKRFRKLSDRYGSEINFVLMDGSFFRRFPIKGDAYAVKYLSVVTYYRLYAERMLPDDVGKVLYLDCDLIVHGPVGELFDMDWDGFALGAVQDITSGHLDCYDRLGYDRSRGYFNAGVLLINLDYWRAHGIERQCIAFLESYYDRVFYNDQDVLNAVTNECKADLPVKYNFQTLFLMPHIFNTLSEEVKEDILGTECPRIIHYIGFTKPWMTEYYAFPYNVEWHEYKSLSPWRHVSDLLPKEKRFRCFIKRYFLWPRGILLCKPELVSPGQGRPADRN